MTKIDYEKENKRRLILDRLCEHEKNPYISTPNQKQNFIVQPDELFKKGKEMNNCDKDIKRNIYSLQILYQRIACSALLHLAQHGNIGIITKVVKEMPWPLCKDSMQKFLETYGPVSFRVDETTGGLKKDKNGYLVPYFDKKKNLQLGLALENPWWLVKKYPK